ncbi:hypothetical protein ADUPG1_000542, partial [Aduncisulcus paluster]
DVWAVLADNKQRNRNVGLKASTSLHPCVVCKTLIQDGKETSGDAREDMYEVPSEDNSKKSRIPILHLPSSSFNPMFLSHPPSKHALISCYGKL